jgi:hypothetical protein
MNVFIIGGGCYGSTYVRQLRKALANDKIPPGRWVVLDRDPNCRVRSEVQAGDPVEFRVSTWVDALTDIVATGELQAGDLVVPSPFQGTLISDWLQAEAAAAGRELAPLPLGGIGEGLRFEQADPAGQVRYVSFAGWTCPVHCIEPSKCPATRGPKAWDLRETLQTYAAREGFDAVLPFACLHWAYGVGTVPSEQFLAARGVVREGESNRLLVASLSTCHGAISAWQLRRR